MKEGTVHDEIRIEINFSFCIWAEIRSSAQSSTTNILALVRADKHAPD
jgi:hypothetical protein